ncbi:hypothetical protein LSTR_LSTR000719 [Laodelphax striatellus]|uniref:Ionotropic glutamate receptor C-terminal domain-containing protein n=1 Tax=Laodelphax striatellus TaxID=195883 RepID=A0A482XGB1_LAOST|nr:hypothetical protein LSTR_LSTR000719 [Laodelphax striatellus]
MFPTPSWGYKWNGTFDGMVSLLMNGTANVGITTAGIRTVRLPVIDFISSQTWLNAPKFILRHPRTARSTLNIFLHPLSPGVWFSIASIVVVTVAGTHFIGWVQVKLSQLKVTDNTWSSCLILVVGAICQQGSSEVPKQMAGRIFFLSLLVFTFVVYQFYTCSIVSTLLTEPPKTIHQLSDIMRTHMTIGVEDILTARDTLYRYQADPEIRNMYLTKIKPKKEEAFHTVEEGVALMKRGGFAFYVDPAAAYKLIEDTFSEQEKCDLTEVWMHEPDVHTLPIQKRSPYKKLFNFGMRLALEYGVVKRERRKWHSRRPECVLAKNHRSHVSIGLAEFRPALLLLAAGMMLALFVLVHEIMHHRGTRRSFRQKEVRGTRRRWAEDRGGYSEFRGPKRTGDVDGGFAGDKRGFAGDKGGYPGRFDDEDVMISGGGTRRWFNDEGVVINEGFAGDRVNYAGSRRRDTQGFISEGFAKGYSQFRGRRGDEEGMVISGDYAEDRGRRGVHVEQDVYAEYRGARRGDAEILEGRLGFPKMRKRSLLPPVDPNP